MTEPCPGCGWRVEGGGAGCRERFEEMIGRDFADPAFFAVHRLFVDAYALQHPDDYCGSAKSLAAHLAGICLILEEGASPATGADFLNRWLDGRGRIEKPELPAERGRTTLGDLAGIDDPAAWRAAVRRWAESVWDAHADLQSLAGAGPRKRGRRGADWTRRSRTLNSFGLPIGKVSS